MQNSRDHASQPDNSWLNFTDNDSNTITTPANKRKKKQLSLSSKKQKQNHTHTVEGKSSSVDSNTQVFSTAAESSPCYDTRSASNTLEHRSTLLKKSDIVATNPLKTENPATPFSKPTPDPKGIETHKCTIRMFRRANPSDNIRISPAIREVALRALATSNHDIQNWRSVQFPEWDPVQRLNILPPNNSSTNKSTSSERLPLPDFYFVDTMEEMIAEAQHNRKKNQVISFTNSHSKFEVDICQPLSTRSLQSHISTNKGKEAVSESAIDAPISAISKFSKEVAKSSDNTTSSKKSNIADKESESTSLNKSSAADTLQKMDFEVATNEELSGNLPSTTFPIGRPDGSSACSQEHMVKSKVTKSNIEVMHSDPQPSVSKSSRDKQVPGGPTNDAMSRCPLCDMEFPSFMDNSAINSHVDECLNVIYLQEIDD
ncbi:uncharacterized protein VTP21DRAFT_9871 [Calcarisporiella thermophila]|uniref:uncharacterized protein n=1 Tax=Calcarisporiella thermophila TaxID=911321 RepID=UPI0037448DD6